MSASSANQAVVRIELHQHAGAYGKTVTVLPRALDDKVARLHRVGFWVHLAGPGLEQAGYIGVPMEGPYEREQLARTEPRRRWHEARSPGPR